MVVGERMMSDSTWQKKEGGVEFEGVATACHSRRSDGACGQERPWESEKVISHWIGF